MSSKLPLNQLRPMLISAFETTDMMKAVPIKIKGIVAEFIIAFYNQLVKLRLCFQTLCWYINGDTGEDGFLGLELQA